MWNSLVVLLKAVVLGQNKLQHCDKSMHSRGWPSTVQIQQHDTDGCEYLYVRDDQHETCN